jgi:hypothetical protein
MPVMPIDDFVARVSAESSFPLAGASMKQRD